MNRLVDGDGGSSSSIDILLGLTSLALRRSLKTLFHYPMIRIHPLTLESAVRTAIPLSCSSDVEVMTHSILASLRLPELFELQNIE